MCSSAWITPSACSAAVTRPDTADPHSTRPEIVTTPSSTLTVSQRGSAPGTRGSTSAWISARISSPGRR
jgi:hypothetical protein